MSEVDGIEEYECPNSADGCDKMLTITEINNGKCPKCNTIFEVEPIFRPIEENIEIIKPSIKKHKVRMTDPYKRIINMVKERFSEEFYDVKIRISYVVVYNAMGKRLITINHTKNRIRCEIFDGIDTSKVKIQPEIINMKMANGDNYQRFETVDMKDVKRLLVNILQ